MMSREHAINRHVLVKIRQDLLRTRRVPPVAHQITDDGEERVQLHARPRHLRIRRIAHELGGGSRGFNVGEYSIAFLAEGQGEEGSTDIGRNACDDDLLLAGTFDGRAYIGVVPSAEKESVPIRECVREGTHLTSPWRRTIGALGYISSISYVKSVGVSQLMEQRARAFGRGPLGPVSAEVERSTGISKSFPSSAWAMMLFLIR
jgi:hypothetical protein